MNARVKGINAFLLFSAAQGGAFCNFLAFSALGQQRTAVGAFDIVVSERPRRAGAPANEGAAQMAAKEPARGSQSIRSKR